MVLGHPSTELTRYGRRRPRPRAFKRRSLRSRDRLYSGYLSGPSAAVAAQVERQLRADAALGSERRAKERGSAITDDHMITLSYYHTSHYSQAIILLHTHRTTLSHAHTSISYPVTSRTLARSTLPRYHAITRPNIALRVICYLLVTLVKLERPLL